MQYRQTKYLYTHMYRYFFTPLVVTYFQQKLNIEWGQGFILAFLLSVSHS